MGTTRSPSGVTKKRRGQRGIRCDDVRERNCHRQPGPDRRQQRQQRGGWLQQQRHGRQQRRLRHRHHGQRQQRHRDWRCRCRARQQSDCDRQGRRGERRSQPGRRHPEQGDGRLQLRVRLLEHDQGESASAFGDFSKANGNSGFRVRRLFKCLRSIRYRHRCEELCQQIRQHRRRLRCRGGRPGGLGVRQQRVRNRRRQHCRGHRHGSIGQVHLRLWRRCESRRLRSDRHRRRKLCPRSWRHRPWCRKHCAVQRQRRDRLGFQRVRHRQRRHRRQGIGRQSRQSKDGRFRRRDRCLFVGVWRQHRGAGQSGDGSREFSGRGRK